ncbi:MAG: NAD-binding protein, partial [Gammaproteobacteria bacterium]|nr:NAD-binding protein [Gammaproteobacteria bacterium]
TVFSIYTSVFAWLFAIGALLSVVQDPAFRQAVIRNAFERNVRRVTDGFYLVCGYGDTGEQLVKALSERALRAIVIDNDQERINDLELGSTSFYVPGLCADAADPAVLASAGLRHPQCIGVIAITNNDHTNLQIAISSKLLNPKIPVICRAESHDTEANMASFGTDHIINPFDTFAEDLAMALHCPSMHLIHEWLTSVPYTPLTEPLLPPRGAWVLCGYGRFGKAVHKHLTREGVSAVIIEAEPELTESPSGTVIGRGTEADTLQQAKIGQAVGIVAGTDDDANNLSIVMTARELNPSLFVVARQNRRRNDAIFAAASLDLVMQRSRIITRKILSLITTPLMADFLELARRKDTDWSDHLLSRVRNVVHKHAPDTWLVDINADTSPSINAAMSESLSLSLKHLYTDPHNRTELLSCTALLLRRHSNDIPLPDAETMLESGDQLLFCGRNSARNQMEHILTRPDVLLYIVTGREMPSGLLWRRLIQRTA